MGSMESIAAAELHIPVYRAAPAGQCRGAVLLIHEVWGLTPHIKSVADRLAGEGYLVLAPNLLTDTDIERHMTTDMPKDLFNPKTRNAVQPKVRALMTPIQTPEFARATARKLKACFDCLYDEAACGRKVAVMGFCFGGTYSFSLAVNEPRLSAAVPFYGHADQSVEELGNIMCPMLYFLGEKDENLMAKLPALQERLHEAKVDITTQIYEDCGHAFFNDSNPYAYNEAAARDAWQRTLEFLRQAFAAV